MQDLETRRTHYRSCHLCEAICGLEIQTLGNRVLSIRGDDRDPFSRGHICPKAAALQDIQEDPDRLRKPLVRTGSDWREVTWEEAFQIVIDGLKKNYQAHGPAGIGIYLGNPNVHNYGMMTHGGRFFNLLRTPNRFSASSVDQMPAQLVSYWMYGHQFLIPIPDLDHTDFFLILGANPLASNGSLMTAPDIRKRLRAIQARGGKLVVIDPRRTETAALADEHHFVRPGSDGLLLAAMLHTLFAEDFVRVGRLTPHLKDLDQLGDVFSAFTPEAVADTTGLDANRIRILAREFAAADRAICYGRMGLCTQAFGALCQWLIQLLNILTGNLDRAGGVLFTKPAMDLVGAPRTKPGHFGSWHSRVRGLPEFAGELPAVTMIEEMLTPGDGQIRAMMTAAGNPVLSTPDGKRLDEALAGLDFMVSVDFYMNETTRHAHVILPPCAPLEHDHFDLVFNLFAVRNTVKFSKAVFSPQPGALEDWEIFEALAQRLAGELKKPLKANLTPRQLVDFAIKNGPYGSKNAPLGTETGIKTGTETGTREDNREDLSTESGSPNGSPNGSPINPPKDVPEVAPLDLKVLLDHPHGIDLGPLQPSLPDRLHTADRKVHLAPPPLLADLDRLERLKNAEPQPKGLLLIGRRHLRSNNSWMHNYRRLVKGKDRCRLLMNPGDAAARNLSDDLRVLIRSRIGELEVSLQISDEMMPGVVSLPHGFGHHRQGTRLSVAESFAGVSVNDLTDPMAVDFVSGNAALNGVPVTVEALP